VNKETGRTKTNSEGVQGETGSGGGKLKRAVLFSSNVGIREDDAHSSEAQGDTTLPDVF
jgi:hypothetical protein